MSVPKTARAALRTLCIVRQEDKVLLGLKQRGFGVGKWNGFGGKVEAGESIEGAAIRELQEEAGIIPTKMTQQGTLRFTFNNGLPELELHVFVVTEFKGIPKATEEMQPRWFALSNIPYEKMWADDPHWLPLVLAGKTVQGTFHFEDESVLLQQKVFSH